jgi:LCP family protein required for cell wall assembly
MSLPVPPPDPLPPVSSTDATVPAEIPVVAKVARRRHRRRTWPQRLLLGLNIVVILGCFGAAGGLVVSRYYGNTLNRVELADPTASAQVSTTAPSNGSDITLPVGTVVIDETTSTEAGAPTETLPEADPEAKNFLITGADNNACIDPNSPYAAAFGNRESMGERSDTIMIMRVDPSTKRAAVLSVPRDLWVTIAGRNSKNRINSAYVRDDPTRLLGTIYNNFGIEVDHFIQIDFCAFKTIVDGLGGVAVPFDYPARDRNTGLDVPTAGCFTFDGDHALAYVRSRKYQYQVDGQWKTDGVSDLGRVSRQQDFLRRVLSAALDRGVTDPDVARSLIKAAQDNVVVDQGLTLSKMLEFVGVLRNFEPGGIATYQIEAEGANVGGNSVLLPRINGDNMQAILAIFKGEAELAGAPVQVFDTTTTAAPTTTSTTVASGPTTTTRGTSSTTSTTIVDEVPVSTVAGPEENVKGIVPPKNVEC